MSTKTRAEYNTHLPAEPLLGESDEFCFGVLVPDGLVLDEPAELRPADLSCDAASDLVVLGLRREIFTNSSRLQYERVHDSV